MKKEELEEVLYCLGGALPNFYYHKDRYALMLLSYCVGSSRKISALRKSYLGKLLHKPLVKEVLQYAGDQQLSPMLLDSCWPVQPHCYRITLDKWDGTYSWNQTSRRGWNLVVQLNFSGQHNQEFRRLLKPKYNDVFAMCGHPVSEKEHTLAWARIDFDLAPGEALIEEIQTDWLRLARHTWQYLDKYGADAI